MVWPIARPRRGGDGEGPPGPPRPKGNPQQPPHGIAHFEGEPSASCVDRDAVLSWSWFWYLLGCASCSPSSALVEPGLSGNIYIRSELTLAHELVE